MHYMEPDLSLLHHCQEPAVDAWWMECTPQSMPEMLLCMQWPSLSCQLFKLRLGPIA